MKKALAIIGLALAASVINLSAQNSNSVPDSLPPLVAQTNVSVNVTVQPVVLTAAQMQGVISMMEAGGVTSTLPVTTTNLQRLTVVRSQVGTNTFYRVMVQLR